MSRFWEMCALPPEAVFGLAQSIVHVVVEDGEGEEHGGGECFDILRQVAVWQPLQEVAFVATIDVVPTKSWFFFVA
jgi:hypothetical protein